MELLEKRVEDHRVPRLMNQRVRAGVMADGRQFDTGRGTPRGSLISPLLAFLPNAPPSLKMNAGKARERSETSPMD